MASSYPGAVDSLPNPAPTDLVENVNPLLDHDQQHANANNAIVAIETYVGPSGAAAGPSTLVGRIKTLEAGGGGGATQRGEWEHYGLKAWNADFLPSTQYGGGNTVSSGFLNIARLMLPNAITVTNLHLFCYSGGVTLTGFYGALYTSAGALLSQSSNIASPSSNTIVTIPLGSPQAVSAGPVYVAFWQTFAGGSSTFLRLSNAGSVVANAGLASPNLRFGTANTGLTTTAPSTMGAQTGNANSFWVAVS